MTTDSSNDFSDIPSEELKPSRQYTTAAVPVPNFQEYSLRVIKKLFTPNNLSIKHCNVPLTGYLHGRITADVTSNVRHVTRVDASVEVRRRVDAVATGGDTGRQLIVGVLELAPE